MNFKEGRRPRSLKLLPIIPHTAWCNAIHNIKKHCTMLLNAVVWGETASPHLREKRNRENAEFRAAPTIQLHFLMLRLLSWNLLFSYICTSTSGYKIKSVLKVETIYYIWPNSV